jgi:hypothetical protein
MMASLSALALLCGVSGGQSAANDPLCHHLNGTIMATLGQWTAGSSPLWVMNANASCRLAGSSGADAILAHHDTLFIFLGDSILRQVFHAFIFGTLRQMPVIVHPNYGTSHHTTMLDEDGGYIKDEFCMEPKMDTQDLSFSCKHIGESPFESGPLQQALKRDLSS